MTTSTQTSRPKSNFMPYTTVSTSAYPRAMVASANLTSPSKKRLRRPGSHTDGQDIVEWQEYEGVDEISEKMAQVKVASSDQAQDSDIPEISTVVEEIDDNFPHTPPRNSENGDLLGENGYKPVKPLPKRKSSKYPELLSSPEARAALRNKQVPSSPVTLDNFAPEVEHSTEPKMNPRRVNGLADDNLVIPLDAAWDPATRASAQSVLDELKSYLKTHGMPDKARPEVLEDLLVRLTRTAVPDGEKKTPQELAQLITQTMAAQFAREEAAKQLDVPKQRIVKKEEKKEPPVYVEPVPKNKVEKFLYKVVLPKISKERRQQRFWRLEEMAEIGGLGDVTLKPNQTSFYDEDPWVCFMCLYEQRFHGKFWKGRTPREQERDRWLEYQRMMEEDKRRGAKCTCGANLNGYHDHGDGKPRGKK